MTRYLSLFFVSFYFLFPAFSQDKIRLEIRSLPANQPANSTLFIAGNFNGWNPKQPEYAFRQDEKGNYFIELSLAPGNYEYKITRGGWEKVETSKDGNDISNRILETAAGRNILLDIAGWKDLVRKTPRSTASKNVRIIDTAFQVPQLNRVRRIWIYLPPNYFSSANRRYPVMYLHDGQNVFEDSSAFSGEWGIDEFMDTTKVAPCILVAIDHGGAKRINEYSPFDMQRFGKGEGGPYLDFIVKTLRPYIDRRYRTQAKRKSTFIAGSSMGGLISFYALLKYPEVFGGAGVFSPAFWVTPAIYESIKQKGEEVKARIYFYVGKKESEEMVPDMLKAFESMQKVSKSRMVSVIRDEGKHNEATWRREFPLFYSWLMQK